MLRIGRRFAPKPVSLSLIGLACSGTLALGASCVVPDRTVPLDDALRRTLAVSKYRESDVFRRYDFSLGHTLQAILKTAGLPDGPNKQADLLDSLVQTFRASSHESPTTHIRFPVDADRAEADLKAEELLNGPESMEPVGLFNRFDLAREDFLTCGEYRIVYAKRRKPEDSNQHFLLIFEGALDNPAAGAEGCRPIAEFWESLRHKTGEDLAKALHQFYYEGIAGARPVVHAEHFGLPYGQVRGNFRMKMSEPWQLREWRLDSGHDGGLIFAAATVKNSPFPPLYGLPSEGEDPKLTALRGRFRAHFLNAQVPQLVAVDRRGLAGTAQNASTLFFEMRSDAPVNSSEANDFDGYQSTATSSDDAQPSAGDLKDRIDERLRQEGMAAQCQLSAEHILNRARVLSCAGCHQPPQHAEIAKGPDGASIEWPEANILSGHMHIDEGGWLSPALQHFFLPLRRQSLETYLARRPDTRPIRSEALPDVKEVRDEARAAITRTQPSWSRAKVSVEDLRAADRVLPGAFFRFRRSH